MISELCGSPVKVSKMPGLVKRLAIREIPCRMQPTISDACDALPLSVLWHYRDSCYRYKASIPWSNWPEASFLHDSSYMLSGGKVPASRL